jgi:hypothetical protein
MKETRSYGTVRFNDSGSPGRIARWRLGGFHPKVSAIVTHDLAKFVRAFSYKSRSDLTCISLDHRFDLTFQLFHFEER